MSAEIRRHLPGTKREATRCPIFLLQTSQMGLTAEFCHGDWEYGDDGEMTYLGGDDPVKLSGTELDDFLYDRGMAKRHWTTFDGGVWFTREEAEAEGERRSYHYGRKGKDWRVFCVCAHGDLEKILSAVSDYESG